MTDTKRNIGFTAVSLGVAVLLIAGCRTSLTGGYWMPSFNSTQQSQGGTALDLDEAFGVETDNSALVYELMGMSGAQRIRLDYWRLSGEGAKAAPYNYDFAGVADFAVAGDDTRTTVNLESIGVMWEPGFETSGFRLGLAAGINLLQFHMIVENITQSRTGEVNLGADSPLAELGVEYMPVPLLGVGAEAGLREWLVLILRGYTFDSTQLNISENFTAKFLQTEAGLLLGRPKSPGFKLFLGYRYLHAEYTYDTNAGDSTIRGPVAELSLRF